MMRFRLFFLWCLCSLIGTSLQAANDSGLRRTEVIYGRKFGTALTLDVLQPSKTNGIGVIWVISGGFYSDHNGINPAYCKAYRQTDSSTHSHSNFWSRAHTTSNRGTQSKPPHPGTHEPHWTALETAYR
jgi:hypothetical protein